MLTCIKLVSEDMVVALQCPSKASVEAQTEMEVGFAMCADGSFLRAGGRSGLCIEFLGLGDRLKKGSVGIVSECFQAYVI
jgi:hypothetical protein